jgi:hypothetical protein
MSAVSNWQFKSLYLVGRVVRSCFRDTPEKATVNVDNIKKRFAYWQQRTQAHFVLRIYNDVMLGLGNLETAGNALINYPVGSSTAEIPDTRCCRQSRGCSNCVNLPWQKNLSRPL